MTGLIRRAAGRRSIQWYFFDENGYMKTGWIHWNEKDYFCDETGAMLGKYSNTGWCICWGRWSKAVRYGAENQYKSLVILM